jgi:hypothetical protein
MLTSGCGVKRLNNSAKRRCLVDGHRKEHRSRLCRIREFCIRRAQRRLRFLGPGMSQSVAGALVTALGASWAGRRADRHRSRLGPLSLGILRRRCSSNWVSGQLLSLGVSFSTGRTPTLRLGDDGERIIFPSAPRNLSQLQSSSPSPLYFLAAFINGPGIRTLSSPGYGRFHPVTTYQVE